MKLMMLKLREYVAFWELCYDHAPGFPERNMCSSIGNQVSDLV